MKRFLSCLTALALAAALMVPMASAAYTDVPAGSALASEVQKAASYGLMNGYSAGIFGYSDSMTRAQFVTVVGRMLGWFQGGMHSTGNHITSAMKIPETLSGSYLDAINFAVEYDVVDTNVAFRPNDPVTRREMAEILMFRLTEKKLVAESITLEVGYDRENVDKGGYRGLTQTDRYGRIIPKAAHGTVRFDAPTNLGSTIINESAKLFERITDPALTVRRITINANKVTPDEGIYQVDFFTDTKKMKKKKKLQQAMLGIKNKYGKNAVLKASSYEEGATMRQRNAQIGGHSAGGSDGKLQK